MTAVRWAISAAFTLGLAWASWWSIQVGRADYYDRLETVEGADKAIALTPQDATHYARKAKMLADSDLPAARAALQKAVALNPSDAGSWIDLGLNYEATREYEAAEKSLQRAATVDRQYLPRWTLANFYFRRGDTAHFWQWAKSSTTMMYADPGPLFRLCGQVSEDGKLIERLGLQQPELHAGYLRYLIDQHRLDLIGPAVEAVLADNREADVPLLLSLCDRRLNLNQVEQSVAIWNRLSASHRIPYEPLDVAAGRSLTNGSFGATPLDAGFDWRLPVLDGVSATAEESPSGLRFTFSGRQPELCEPLVQFLPVQENTGYELSYGYQTSPAIPESGLRWRITNGLTGAVLAETAALASDPVAEGRLAFRSPEDARFIRLSLAYRRAPATVRYEGSLLLSNVKLTRTVAR